MIGQNNGVVAQLKKVNPVIINVHCICHKLALACTDTNKEIAYIKRVEETLRQLWTYFENSPERLAVLLKTQINIKKSSLQLTEKSKQILVKRLTKACSTRWLSLEVCSCPVSRVRGRPSYSEWRKWLCYSSWATEEAERGKLPWSAFHFKRCSASPVPSVKGISSGTSGLLSNCSPD